MAVRLPAEFEARMKQILGDEYDAFLESYDQPRKFGLRVNTVKISSEEFERISPFHLTPIPWIPGGYYYLEEDRAARHPHYFAGLYYLQEPSAMTPASVLDVMPGQRVLDLCAAPGGKATALGAKLKGEGLLVANDISATRARALLRNIELFGIPNSYVTNAAPARLAQIFPEFFDRILVDAPCSGEGMFRKDEDVIRAWHPGKSEECAALQKEIVVRACSMLRPGGRLLYSTCTFSPLENEEMIAYLLRECPEMHLIPIPYREGFSEGLEQYGEEMKNCVRLWPHKIGGEGHFMALLEKEETGEHISVRMEVPGSMLEEAGLPALGKKERPKRKGKGADKGRKDIANSGKKASGKGEAAEYALVEEFFKQIGAQAFLKDSLEVRSGQAYLSAVSAQLYAGVPFLRNGLYLGEVRKDRFEPSQPLALALKPGEVNCVFNLSSADERLLRYLRGETIVLDQEDSLANGWKLVCADGHPLGWGKLAGTVLKNKYPAGWRIRNF